MGRLQRKIPTPQDEVVGILLGLPRKIWGFFMECTVGYIYIYI